MPTYGATKAAVHAYSEALRAQLAGTGVEVAELVPPAVATRIGSSNPHALALDALAGEVARIEPVETDVQVRADGLTTGGEKAHGIFSIGVSSRPRRTMSKR